MREPLLEIMARDQCARGFALGEVWYRFAIEIERVEEQAARRTVRAGVCGIVEEQRVQRIEPDDVRTAAAPLIDDGREIGEVADAPVAARTHAVELDHRSPYALAVVDCRWPVARCGRDDEARFTDRLCVGGKSEAMVAMGKGGQSEHANLERFVAVSDALGYRRIGEKIASHQRTVLARDLPDDLRLRETLREVNAHLPRLTDPNHHGWRQSTADVARVPVLQRLPDRGVVPDSHPHRSEERLARRVRCVVLAAVDIVIRGQNAAVCRELRERFVFVHGAEVGITLPRAPRRAAAPRTGASS